MKVLLNSPELISSIIVSVRFRRDYWIKELARYKKIPVTLENKKDLEMIYKDFEKIIQECNEVLDELDID